MTRRITISRDGTVRLLLVEIIIKGQLWTPEQRKDARILVALLSDHALASERRTAA